MRGRKKTKTHTSPAHRLVIHRIGPTKPTSGSALTFRAPMHFSRCDRVHRDAASALRAIHFAVDTKTLVASQLLQWLARFFRSDGDDAAVFQPQFHHLHQRFPKPRELVW